MFCLDVDDCFKKPCQNGDVCVDGINTYSCKCKTGYTGGNCETSKFYNTVIIVKKDIVIYLPLILWSICLDVSIEDINTHDTF